MQAVSSTIAVVALMAAGLVPARADVSVPVPRRHTQPPAPRREKIYRITTGCVDGVRVESKDEPGIAAGPDVAAGMRLSATMDGSRIRAVLENVGTGFIHLDLGYSCGGPFPFTYQVDSLPAESFALDSPRICMSNFPITRMLGPGDSIAVWSADLVDPCSGRPYPAGEHRIQVAFEAHGGRIRASEVSLWRGRITAAPIRAIIPEYRGERRSWEYGERTSARASEVPGEKVQEGFH